MLHLSPHGYAAWGFRFRFESDDPLLVDVVARLYTDLPKVSDGVSVICAVSGGAGEPMYRVTIESPSGEVEECGAGRTRDAIVELLCWEVNRRALLSAAGEVVLHAAVVAGEMGAVALCADSQGGKSTLAAAAARRGWRHLSDDMCLVDVERVTAMPYARPLMLRAGGRGHLGDVAAPPPEHCSFFPDEWFFPASELGAAVGEDAVPLVAVCFLAWQPHASLERMSQAQVLHDLVRHSATVARQGEVGFRRLEQIARGVPGFRVGLGAATDVLDLLADLVRPTAQR